MEKLGAIVERRRSDQPAKVVKKRHGPDIVFSYGDLPPVEEGQFLVAISIEKPKVSSSTPGKAAAADGTVTRNGTLAEGSKNLSSDDSTIQSHQKTLRDNVRVCAAVNEVQKIQRTDYDSIPDTIKALPTTLTSLQRFIEMLKQEAEIVVSTSSIDYDGKPLKWDVGDILELDATEAANPKNGVSGGFFILYNWL